MKKLIPLLILYFVLIYFSGHTSLILTGNRILSNLLSIIIPSLILGILAAKIMGKKFTKKLQLYSAMSLGVFKVVMVFILVAKLPTILALILMLVLYPLIAWGFIKLGTLVISK